MTDLVNAVTDRDAATVKGLLAAGVDPDEPNEDGTTPLYRAAVNGSTELVRVLLAQGADPNLPSGAADEGLPLCAAACWNHAGVVEALLAAGADPDLPEPPHPEQTGPGTPPLLWAVRNGHRESVDLLLAAGADPNTPGNPLTVATRGGRYGIVRSLLERGANPACADDTGRTASAIAIELADADLVALLAGESLWKDRAFTVDRRPAGDGSELITLRFGRDGSYGQASIQNGHRAIAALLEEVLGRGTASRDSL
ncbi:hypothetical protein B0T44_16735 [Nocardia donostiensis]|uniref:Uncharacterized protein n=1 Tax=Nocardia donostiensis TaxID=1538463 RepID=A0A1V2TGB9_9NOCA|nr:hypothetical protein B0T46_12545 [Nocardia donostiensis]OQS16100.1 hypothetical protein B0T36_04655 [Nocardia donostiensis]OQS19003.1 hypothetical protein B0T44_16735 [Nocardia donostiensis]